MANDIYKKKHVKRRNVYSTSIMWLVLFWGISSMLLIAGLISFEGRERAAMLFFACFPFLLAVARFRIIKVDDTHIIYLKYLGLKKEVYQRHDVQGACLGPIGCLVPFQIFDDHVIIQLKERSIVVPDMPSEKARELIILFNN